MPDPSPPASPDRLPADTRLGRTALRVADRQALTTFYRDVVGLSVQREGDIATVLGAGDAPLLVLEDHDGAPTRHSTRAGLFHTAFRVPTRAALGDALARIRDQWQLGGTADHLVSEALYLTDPEGNGVEIYHDYPRDDWPTSGTDDRVKMDTLPLDLDPLETAATGATSVPPGTDVGHVHLEVTSLDAFRAVYVDTVGFDVRTTVPNAVFVAAGGYHHHVGANTWHGRTRPREGSGLAWFEVLVPNRATLDALAHRARAGDLAVSERDGGVAVTDLDGIEVRFRIDPES